MASGTYYPPVGFYFQVKFQGGGIAGESAFQEVSGLSVEIPAEEIKEGGEVGTYSLPGRVGNGKITLKRGLVTDSSIRGWIQKAVESFQFTPVTLVISLLNEKGSPLKSWTVENAWPTKWEVGNFNSMDNSVAVETLELSFYRFKVT